jgi:hypothetical protein
MKTELKTSQAAHRAPFCVRSSVAAVLVAVSLVGGGAAGAAGGPPGPQQQPPQRDEAPRFNDSRGAEQRDSRADEQRRAMQERADASRRNGRLTPDERRDLRRQINEAGQDIYSTPPRR